MKGDERVVKMLDELLSDELTAINQYMVHSEMCENWGYDRLHQAVEKRAQAGDASRRDTDRPDHLPRRNPNSQPVEPDPRRRGRAETDSIG